MLRQIASISMGSPILSIGSYPAVSIIPMRRVQVDPVQLKKGLSISKKIKRKYDSGESFFRFSELHVDRWSGVKSAAERVFNTFLANEVVNAKVCDLASGRGLLSFFALECGAREVVALDISQKMINETRKKLGKQNPNNRFIVGDIFYASNLLDSERGSFDIVTLGNTAHAYSADKIKSLMFLQAFELLRAGGKFVIFLREYDENPMVENDYFRWLYNNRSCPPLMFDQYSGLLKKVGFKNIEYKIGSIETDEDWGVELGDYERPVNRNIVILAQKPAFLTTWNLF